MSVVRLSGVVILIWIAIACWGQQVDPLVRVMQGIPASYGENTTIMRGREGWVDFGIAQHMGYEHLKRANPRGFGPGAQLLLPGRRIAAGITNDGLVINLPELMLYQWKNGQVQAHYPVSIGRVTSRWHTPEGDLTVVNMRKNPAWHQPDWAGGRVIPAGPRNPLGDRWIGLSRAGYGIHGTSDQTSIGRTVSHGCIRMFPAHVRTLFAAVRVDLPVMITYQTMVVGQQNGVIYLAVFPDVYSRGTNTLPAAKARLTTLGITGVVADEALANTLTTADGVAQPIFGSAMRLLVNGQPLSLPVGPEKRDETYYVPLRLLAPALGATVSWDEATNTASVVRGEAQVRFQLGVDAAFIAMNTLYVPVRTLVEGVKGTVTLEAGALVITG